MMPQNSEIDLPHWHELMQTFGLAENNEIYRKLIKAYSEKHRAYHTLEHIAACFEHLGDVEKHADNPHEIKLALWFHDVIYNPFSGRNEEDSAEFAKQFLLQNSVSQDVIQRIYDLIISTKEHVLPTSPDGKLMLDIDLSILGAAESIYAQFEKDIRREYRRVPFFIFKKKRKEVLKSFSLRPTIYHTDYFFARFEEQAKKNLHWAIRKL